MTAYQQPPASEGGGKQTFPPEPPEGTDPADTFISDFQSPEPGELTFLLLKPPSCGTV